MICKKCGENLAKRERFCPYCGSYFIAAEDETDGRMWKGVITSDGTLETKVNVANKPKEISSINSPVNKVKSFIGIKNIKNTSTVTVGRRIWAIIGLAIASFMLICNIVDKYAPSSDAGLYGFVLFPLGLAGMILGRRSKFAKFAWLPFIAAIIIFIN